MAAEEKGELEKKVEKKKFVSAKAGDRWGKKFINQQKKGCTEPVQLLYDTAHRRRA